MREILEHIEWEIERGELIRFHTGHDAIDYIKVLARDDKLWPSLTPTFEKVMRTPLVPGVAFTTTFDSQLKMTGQPRLSLIGLHFHLFLFDYCHDQISCVLCCQILRVTSSSMCLSALRSLSK